MKRSYCIKCEELTEPDFRPQIIDGQFYEVEVCSICTYKRGYYDNEGNKVSEPRRGQLLIVSFCIPPKRKEQIKDLVRLGKFCSLSEFLRTATKRLIDEEHPDYSKLEPVEENQVHRIKAEET